MKGVNRPSEIMKNRKTNIGKLIALARKRVGCCVICGKKVEYENDEEFTMLDGNMVCRDHKGVEDVGDED